MKGAIPRARRAGERATTVLVAGLAALTLVQARVQAGSSAADDIDGFVDAQRQWMRIPGLSLAVVEDGRVVKAAGYGKASLELDSPATAETAYRLGSTSKQFLAAAIPILQQEGKLTLDDRLSDYVKDTPEAWKGITLRHLLTHTSGLPKEAPAFDPFKEQADADVVRSAYAVPLEFAPGARWSYSNTGYYALAEVVTTVSGRPWTQFIAERVFAPAGMAATRITALDVVPHRATGYMSARGIARDAETWLAVRPSGGVVSTVLDLAKWDAALRGDTILNASSKGAMWTPVTLTDGSTHGYGFGWFIDNVRGHRRIRHDGGVPGFVSEIDLFVDDGLTVILLANLGNRDLRDLTLDIASRYRPVLTLEPEAAIEDPAPDLARQLRTVVEGAIEGRIDRRFLTSSLADSLAGDLASGLGDGLRSLGPLGSVDLLERKVDGEHRTSRYRLAFRYGRLFATCTYDPDGRISQLAIGD